MSNSLEDAYHNLELIKKIRRKEIKIDNTDNMEPQPPSSCDMQPHSYQYDSLASVPRYADGLNVHRGISDMILRTEQELCYDVMVQYKYVYRSATETENINVPMAATRLQRAAKSVAD